METPRNDLISIVLKVSKPFLSGSLQIFVKLLSRLRLCTVWDTVVVDKVYS